LRLAEHMQSAHPRFMLARPNHQHVVNRKRALHQRTGDDRAVTGQRERAIDRQIRRRMLRARRQGDERGMNRRTQRIEPGAGLRRHRDDRRVFGDRSGDGRTHARAREVAFALVGEIRLGENDDRRRDREQREDREVLEGLRTRSLVCGDNEQQHVHPGRAGKHIVHEAFVTRHVDEARFDAVGKAQMREAEIERHAAPALFFPAIGLGSGECAHQRRFAVIDVAGRADDAH
jgi:hypothetical protein